ncbi:MAG: DUF4163 domain-containing protein [Oscillospiraceae bacterium]|nr:DUF4163 domain-containing protein [Oscillospiraceae bacterium]
MKEFRWALILLAFLLTGCVDVSGFPTPTIDFPEPPEVSDAEPYLPADPSPDEPPAIPSPVFPSPSEIPALPSAELPEWVPNGLAVETLLYENDFTDGETVCLQAYGAYPQTGNPDIDGYYARCRDDFERMCGELSETAALDASVYQCVADYFVECNAGGVLSVSRTVYTNTGGAHGMTDLLCETFSAVTGELLSLDDFFSVDRDTYTARLLQNVNRVIDEHPDQYWDNAKELAAEVFPYDVFCVSEKGITLLYHEYTLGSYSTGIVRIDIPLEEIADIFTLPGAN